MALRLVAPVDGPATQTSAAPTTGAAAVAQVTNRAAGLLDAHDLAGWRALVAAAAAARRPPRPLPARGACCSSPSCATARRTGAQNAERLLAGALAAVEVLEDDAARAGPAQPRRRPALRAGRDRRRRGALPRRPAPGPRAARRRAPTCASASAAASRASPRRRACRRRCCARCATSARAPSASPRRPCPRPTRRCQPLHDRQGRGGDAPALPGRRRRVRRRADRRRHRLDRPRRSRSPSRSARKVLHHEWDGDFAAARNVGLDAATGDWLMYLDADEVLVEGDGPRLRELLGHTWREGIFLTETNHVGELRGRRRRPAQRAAPLPQPPRVPLRGPRPRAVRPQAAVAARARRVHAGPHRALRLPRRRPRRQGEVAPQPRAAGAPDRRGRRHAVPALQPRLRARRRRRRRRLAGPPRARLGEGSQATPSAWSYGYFPSLCARLVKALNANGRHDEAIAQADEILALLPGLHRPRARAGDGRTAASATARRGDRALRALHRDGRRARALQRHGRRRHLPRPQPAGRDAASPPAAWTRPRPSSQHVLEHHPAFIGAVEPYARVLLRSGTPAAEVAARVAALVPEPTPGQRFLLAVPLLRGGAVAEAARRSCDAVLAAQPGAHAARIALGRGAAVAAATSPAAAGDAARGPGRRAARPGRRPDRCSSPAWPAAPTDADLRRRLRLRRRRRHAIRRSWPPSPPGAAARAAPAAVPAAAAAAGRRHARGARAPGGLRRLRAPGRRRRAARPAVARAARAAGRRLLPPRLPRVRRQRVVRRRRAPRRPRRARAARPGAAWPTAQGLHEDAAAAARRGRDARADAPPEPPMSAARA